MNILNAPFYNKLWLVKLVSIWMMNIRESLFKRDDNSRSDSICVQPVETLQVHKLFGPHTLGTTPLVPGCPYWHRLYSAAQKPRGVLDNQHHTLSLSAVERLVSGGPYKPPPQNTPVQSLSLICGTPHCSASLHNACPWVSHRCQ